MRGAEPRLERPEVPFSELLRWGVLKVELTSVDMRKPEGDESLGEDMVLESVESLWEGGDGAMVLDWNSIDSDGWGVRPA